MDQSALCAVEPLATSQPAEQPRELLQSSASEKTQSQDAEDGLGHSGKVEERVSAKSAGSFRVAKALWRLVDSSWATSGDATARGVFVRRVPVLLERQERLSS